MNPIGTLEIKAARHRWRRRNDSVMAENRCPCGAPGHRHPIYSVSRRRWSATGLALLCRSCGRAADDPLGEWRAAVEPDSRELLVGDQ